MTNAIALITGGSRGLGRNTAIALARLGTDVVLTYHSNKAQADSAVAEIQKLGRRATALQLNTGDASSFDAFVVELKKSLKTIWNTDKFDQLVNNAGTGLHAAFTDTTEAQFDSLMNVHVKGPYFLTQKLLPLMNDGGRIVMLSSGLARFSMAGVSAYASMKGAVEVLARCLAKELGPRGIAVNAFAPGAIATDFGGGTVRDNPEVNKMVAANTALGRAGEPDDIGPAIASLLSPANRWINGQRIEASGGMFV
ncbi:SDR family NAD(P)-dependent oxidoreductase [Pinirhizobacter sp.]|jgi:NAD(P)-dependent dehydrogenase (short-subunit alcohol dehydrogenase family)|uniref:SDR family NAD(P)-dependent oxidoreductase n=1 Tax=Pinirhizobacter sp. TaxID=2950432 RepID=UPI002F4161AA